MEITPFSVILALFAAGGIASFILRKNERVSALTGSILCCSALATALVFNIIAPIISRQADFTNILVYRIPIIFTGFAAAIHAPGYLKGHSNGRTGIFQLFFNFTLGAMYAVTEAQNFIPFIIAWELMGLFSFALVAFDANSKQAMRAAWIYLMACEAGGMLLMFTAKSALAVSTPPLLIFFLLFTAFGLKAGFPFMHVWLPEAHPAAPAPVSAVMSGAMIPLGFCGLIRFMPVNPFMPPVPGMYLTFGWSLIAVGTVGAFFGILAGAAQKDLKRLLAYSSVENMGITSLGFGLGFLGKALNLETMEACGFAGAYLHIINHAFLKGALFLGAGSVYKATHTLNMDLMGGLIKKMPFTGGIFAVSSAGISGLPPFCGFTGEILIYAACFYGMANAAGSVFFGAFACAVTLALTGGTACAAFAKALSGVFQGEPRTEYAINAHREEKSMVCALFILMIPALLMPFIAPYIPYFAQNETVGAILKKNALFTLVFGSFTTLLIILHYMKGCAKRTTGTWDCGYAKPSARMEYTPSAFIQPVADLFNGFLKQKKHIQHPDGFFPEKASIDVENDDFSDRTLWRPLFIFFGNIAEKVHRFQSGYLHLYILVMAAALIIMLIVSFASELTAVTTGGK